MLLSRPLLCGRLVARRKRFFVDVALADGSVVVAHCPNTGRMSGCLQPGAEVILHGRDTPGRALPWTWVLVRVGRTWVGVESARATTLVAEAIAADTLPGLGGFAAIHRELPYGDALRSRVDLVLATLDDRAAVAALAQSHARTASSVWIEVKATTLLEVRAGARVAAFPDAPTVRGRKHLEDLVEVRRRGQRAALVFAVVRGDAECFAPADDIDPAYGAALRRAITAGVEVFAVGTSVRVVRESGAPTSVRIALDRAMPLRL